jgi:hypothetical protein
VLVPCHGVGVVGVQVANSGGTFTVTFEGTADDTNWVAVQAANMNDGAVATTTSAAGIFVVPVAGLSRFRARISAASGCSLTATALLFESGGVTLADIDVAGTETVTLAAAENHVGEFGGNSAVVEVTLSLDTGAYAADDVLAATQEVASAARVNGGKIVLQSVVLLDEDDNSDEIDLVFLKTNVALGTENAAVSITDANAREIMGVVNVGTADYVDLVGSQVAIPEFNPIVMTADAGATSIYVAAILRSGTPTHTASGIQLMLGFLRD